MGSQRGEESIREKGEVKGESSGRRRERDMRVT